MSGTDTGPGPANAPGPDEHLASSDQTQRELADIVAGLELRSIGPALMGGRIADIAVDPRGKTTWYLAVGSGLPRSNVTRRPSGDRGRSWSAPASLRCQRLRASAPRLFQKASMAHSRS